MSFFLHHFIHSKLLFTNEKILPSWPFLKLKSHSPSKKYIIIQAPRINFNHHNTILKMTSQKIGISSAKTQTDIREAAAAAEEGRGVSKDESQLDTTYAGSGFLLMSSKSYILYYVVDTDGSYCSWFPRMWTRSSSDIIDFQGGVYLFPNLLKTMSQGSKALKCTLIISFQMLAVDLYFMILWQK